MVSRTRGLLTVVVVIALLLVAGLPTGSYASAGNTVVTFDDPAGVYLPGDATEKGVRVWTDDGFKFHYSDLFPDGPDNEINLGNFGKTIKIAKVDNSPFTLLSFFASSLPACCTSGITIRGYDATNTLVASMRVVEQYPGFVISLPATFSGVSRVEIQSANAGGGRNNHSLDDFTLEGGRADTTPPVVTAPAPITVECGAVGGTPTTDPTIQAWLAAATAVDDSPDPVMTNDAPAFCSLGDTTVTFTATDASGNSASAQSTITVVDTTAPSITGGSASPASLWPANHKMEAVTISVSASDVCDPSVACSITSVTSNEPVDGLGDGDTAPDWAITGPLTVDLRAERSGTGNGRVYTITVTCVDDSGNTATKTIEVTAPHSMGRGR